MQLFPVFLCVLVSTLVGASPSQLMPPPTRVVRETAQDAQPTFPANPPSCYICAGAYPTINSCALAAPVFENFTQIIFNPGAFVTTIECACTDTFQSVYPQCVDCFQQTNQTSFLNTSMEHTPKILQGMRQICTLASVILGHPVSANGEAEGQTPTTVPSPTHTAAARSMLQDLAPLKSVGVALITSVLAAGLMWA